jgi:hypothetical protein
MQPNPIADNFSVVFASFLYFIVFRFEMKVQVSERNADLSKLILAFSVLNDYTVLMLKQQIQLPALTTLIAVYSSTKE